MNYDYIGRSLIHYKRRGYAYIEDAPWLVDKTAYYATKPPDVTDVVVSPMGKYFVASGEQSFLQLLLDGRMIKRAVCVTPCFRMEKHDDWHRPYFMKAELINADEPTKGNLMLMIHDAMGFFEQFCEIRVLETGLHQYDIVEKTSRTELGSYGIREMLVSQDGRPINTVKWIYGTGCAEPRLSTAVARRAAQMDNDA